MSEAAAFFANKKKKKKAFKFNANKIDATTVTQTVHVDAPALSTEHNVVAATGTLLASTTIADVTTSSDQNDNTTTLAGGADGAATTDANNSTTNSEWDDEKLAASYAKKGAPVVSASAELLDMKALESKRNEQDDIAERMRIEETKAQLLAAKQGMEREAQRIKDEEEKKKEDLAKKNAPSTATAGSGIAAGGKWLAPHMRSAGAGGLSRMRMGGAMGSMPQRLDTKNEELFPDLAAAAEIDSKKKDEVLYKVVKKTPVGGGATWGSKPAAPKVSKQPLVVEPTPEPSPKEEPAAEPVATVSAAPVPKKKPLKKKKKDLSTFKPS